MLKVNKHVTKMVTGAVSASILTHSCVPYANQDDSLYSFDLQKGELGKNAIPLRINLDPDQAAYLGFIQKLSEDIIKYPIVAKQFYNNPKLFLERYGYKGSINMDDDLLQLIIALGDEDINKSVRLGDASLFIDLCSKKGLLKNSDEMYANLRNQLDNQLIDMDLELLPIEELQASVGLVLIITVIIALVIAVNVTVTHTKTDDVLGDGPEYYAKNNTKQYITEHNPVLSVWFMKQTDKSYALVDKYTEHQIDEIILKIKEKNPIYFEKKSEEDFRNMIKLNIIMTDN
jgi:hypothetical protein